MPSQTLACMPSHPQTSSEEFPHALTHSCMFSDELAHHCMSPHVLMTLHIFTRTNLPLHALERLHALVQPRMTLHILAYPRMPQTPYALQCSHMASHHRTPASLCMPQTLYVFAGPCMFSHTLTHLCMPSHVLAHCYVCSGSQVLTRPRSPPTLLHVFSHPCTPSHSLIHPSMLCKSLHSLACSHILTCLQMPLYTSVQAPDTPSHMLALVACSHAPVTFPPSLHALIVLHSITQPDMLFASSHSSHALAHTCKPSCPCMPSPPSHTLARTRSYWHILYTLGHVHTCLTCPAHYCMPSNSSHALAQPRMLLHAVSCRHIFLHAFESPSTSHALHAIACPLIRPDVLDMLTCPCMISHVLFACSHMLSWSGTSSHAIAHLTHSAHTLP